MVKRRGNSLTISWKRIAKNISYAILFATFILSVAKLKNTQYFPIKDVKIFGVEHSDHREIESMVAPLVSNGFFSVDVEKIKEQIRQLPWVGNVMVRRVWPNEVIITVNEKNPIALWNDTSLLSSAGELFTPEASSYPHDLPQFEGPAGNQILMAEYYDKINNVLLPLHFKVARLELSTANAWMVTLNNGIKLTVGHKDILTRLSHFVKVYPKIVGDRVAEIEYIDLRYTNGIAVRWKSVT